MCIRDRLYGEMEDKMTREAVFETLNEVFRDVFDDESISVTENTTSNDIEDWDSLEHIKDVYKRQENESVPAFGQKGKGEEKAA